QWIGDLGGPALDVVGVLVRPGRLPAGCGLGHRGHLVDVVVAEAGDVARPVLHRGQLPAVDAAGGTVIREEGLVAVGVPDAEDLGRLVGGLGVGVNAVGGVGEGRPEPSEVV